MIKILIFTAILSLPAQPPVSPDTGQELPMLIEEQLVCARCHDFIPDHAGYFTTMFDNKICMHCYYYLMPLTDEKELDYVHGR